MLTEHRPRVCAPAAAYSSGFSTAAGDHVTASTEQRSVFVRSLIKTENDRQQVHRHWSQLNQAKGYTVKTDSSYNQRNLVS